MSESFAELFEESIANLDVTPGRLLTGTVLDISNDYVLIHAGLKSEAYVPISQFGVKDGQLEVGIGDEVEVVLNQFDNGRGEPHLSRSRAREMRTWSRLEHASAAGETVIGTVISRVKGGLSVDMGEVRAFLPGSLIAVRPVKNTADFEGQELEFKVIKLDQKRNNVVVSRRAVVEHEHNEEREQLLKNLKEGQRVKGIVKNLTDYGAFVDLGGVDGLLHITDISWQRIKHPSEIVSVGDEIEVLVLKCELAGENGRDRISLGFKQLGDDPWQGAAMRYPKGVRFTGKVTNVTEYGCFVSLEDGIEGLVHVSEMDWIKRNINPVKQFVREQELEVMVLDVDEHRRRMSLGIKQCFPNPWQEFADKYNKGDIIKGTINSITDFGLFVGLEFDIDGLVHFSDISWTDSGEQAIFNYKKGDEVEVMVLSVDELRGRVSLGIKHILADPFVQYVADNPKGSIVEGIVSDVQPNLSKVQLVEHVEGFMRLSGLSNENARDMNEELKVGDKIEAKLIAVDSKARKIQLSIRAKDTEVDEEMMQDYGQTNRGGATLGEFIEWDESAEQEKEHA